MSDDTIDEAERVDRRTALGRFAVGGGALVAGAVIGGGTAAAVTNGGGGWKREELRLHVACLGDTWQDSTANYPASDSDFRGMPFSVEGWIYPDGFIPPGDGFVPTADGSIGRWLCRGATLVWDQRLEPHVQTTQEFIWGPMAGEQLFAADNITTSGVEGTVETNQVARRAVVGGTGQYLGASGEQRQEWTGFNTSVFNDGTGPALNFAMHFDLLLPDV